ncbi:MAG: redox-regulated ATPase YchF [Bacillota bacterium]|nr:redox-regulated ATPase YchF [Bacillota bacterium]MDW7678086.1 redox-regulated ATPase YchF [Bacillota bacterium]
MKMGIVGLPTTGKTTLFNLLTGQNLETTGFSTGKVEAHTGIAKIPDIRIDFLASQYKPKKTTYATIELVDVPGLSKGASTGKGVGNQFLDAVRKADALIHLVRVFRNPQVMHPEGSIDPLRDVETIAMELLFSDLAVIENRISRINAGKKITRELQAEKAVMEKCQKALEDGQLIHELELDEEEQELLRNFGFLSEKPMMLVVNLDESQLSEGSYPQKAELETYCQEHQLPLIALSAQTEQEISQLDEGERLMFMEELNIQEPGIYQVARTSYELLGLISFLTAGEDEVRAWPIRKDTVARKAAGKIHTDIEKGFIRAEVTAFTDYKDHPSMVKLKELGKVRLEGKEYVVQDGDIMNFRFNV